MKMNRVGPKTWFWRRSPSLLWNRPPAGTPTFLRGLSEVENCATRFRSYVSNLCSPRGLCHRPSNSKVRLRGKTACFDPTTASERPSVNRVPVRYLCLSHAATDSISAHQR